MFYGGLFKNTKFAEFCFEIYENIFRAQRRETQLMKIIVFKSLKFLFHFKLWLKPIPTDNLHCSGIEL